MTSTCDVRALKQNPGSTLESARSFGEKAFQCRSQLAEVQAALAAVASIAWIPVCEQRPDRTERRDGGLFPRTRPRTYGHLNSVLLGASGPCWEIDRLEHAPCSSGATKAIGQERHEECWERLNLIPECKVKVFADSLLCQLAMKMALRATSNNLSHRGM